ncbi:Chorismate--pyruvate lyase [Klebsiella pneumoniae IS43]|uniref:Chorismate--pyruvate lyase n=1 Tax=Klebsiella pneumoniae IS43 TaxID=1432552 RepID=W1DXS9_KLEPN|nr:Chorismate--pyruvate lyase [Klebsiella pneumoniae IS43]
MQRCGGVGSRLRLSGKPLLLTELFFACVAVVLRGRKNGVESVAE